MEHPRIIRISAVITLIFVISTLFTSIQSVSSTASMIPADNVSNVAESPVMFSPDEELRQIPEMDSFEDDFSDYKRIERAFIRHQLAKNQSLEESNSDERLFGQSKTAANGDIVVNLDVEKSIYVPGEMVNYSVQATDGMEAATTSIEIYILKGETNNFWRFLYGYENPGSLGLEVIESKSVNTDGDGFYSSSFTPSESDSYIIVVKNQYSYYWNADYRYITVSPIGIFWRLPIFFIPFQELDSYAIALNASDFTPIEGAQVTLEFKAYDYDYELQNELTVFTGTTGMNGLCQIDITGPNIQPDVLIVSLTVNASGQTSTVSRSLWSYYWSQQFLQKYEFIITTDKPIYQPGEMIRTRTLVRESDFYNALKQSVPGITVKAEVKTPSRFLLFRKNIVSSEHGILLLDFQLDEDAEIGSYFLELTTENSTASYEIEVKRYEKPAFRVNIVPEKEYVEPGTRMKGEIVAEYYFGKPVVDGAVTIEFYWKEETEPFGTFTGIMGADGKLSFSQLIPTNPDEYRYYYYYSYITIRATVDTQNCILEVKIISSSPSVTRVYFNFHVKSKKTENICLINGYKQGARTILVSSCRESFKQDFDIKQSYTVNSNRNWFIR